MTEEVELFLLADKCRSIATLTTDESTVQALHRLADGYETKAKVCEYLANGLGSVSAMHGRSPGPAVS